MKKIIIFITVFAISFSLQGCSIGETGQTSVEPGVLAKVNDITITQSDINYTKKLENITGSLFSDVTKSSDAEILDNWIRDAVISLECQKLGIVATEEEINKHITESLEMIKDDSVLLSDFDKVAKALGMKDTEEYFKSDIYKEATQQQLNSEKLLKHFIDNNPDIVNVSEEYITYIDQLIDSYDVIKY